MRVCVCVCVQMFVDAYNWLSVSSSQSHWQWFTHHCELAANLIMSSQQVNHLEFRVWKHINEGVVGNPGIASLRRLQSV